MSTLHYVHHYELYVRGAASMDSVVLAVGRSATLRPDFVGAPVVIEPRNISDWGLWVRLHMPSDFPAMGLDEEAWLRLLGEVAEAAGCPVDRVSLYNPWNTRTLIPGHGWSEPSGLMSVTVQESISVLECGLWEDL